MSTAQGYSHRSQTGKKQWCRTLLWYRCQWRRPPVERQTPAGQDPESPLTCCKGRRRLVLDTEGNTGNGNVALSRLRHILRSVTRTGWWLKNNLTLPTRGANSSTTFYLPQKWRRRRKNTPRTPGTDMGQRCCVVVSIATSLQKKLRRLIRVICKLLREDVTRVVTLWRSFTVNTRMQRYVRL